MDSKLIGSTLLIVGTSIGAGMLALPIATAELGFISSILLLVGCWFVMTVGAFLLLEVNLWLPQNSNLISMAKFTIGRNGQILTWIMYFLLLYSLLSAYIAGGSDLFHNLLLANHLTIPLWSSAILFTLIFGTIVYLGIRAVDYVNRGLMFVKLIAYISLVILAMPFISPDYLTTSNIKMLTSATALTVTITSFGFASIVPSLRIYFAGDIKKLKTAILIGSLIPLVCYIFWDAVIMGIIPLGGSSGLIAIVHSKTSTSDMVNTLTTMTQYGVIAFCIRLFTSICVVTSFLGVALCLTDFLADGFKLEKMGIQNIFIQLLTFLPPLIIVLFVPNAFIKALSYAGIYCVFLLMLLPAWMAWRGRYLKKIAHGFQVFGGKPLLIIIMGLSILFIVRGFAG